MWLGPFHNPVEPASIRFFLIAIIFLAFFYLEISYLFP